MCTSSYSKNNSICDMYEISPIMTASEHILCTFSYIYFSRRSQYATMHHHGVSLACLITIIIRVDGWRRFPNHMTLSERQWNLMHKCIIWLLSPSEVKLCLTPLFELRLKKRKRTHKDFFLLNEITHNKAHLEKKARRTLSIYFCLFLLVHTHICLCLLFFIFISISRLGESWKNAASEKMFSRFSLLICLNIKPRKKKYIFM